MDERHLVDHFRGVGHDLCHPSSRLAMLLELEDRAEQLRDSLEKGEPLPLDQVLGDRLAVIFRQLRFVVEEFELRGRAGHQQENDALGLRREVRVARRHWVLLLGSGEALAGHQRRQPHRADADAGLLEEVPTGDVEKFGIG